MTGFVDAEAFYIARILLVFGGAYMWAERDYVSILNRHTGARLPVAGAGLGWFLEAAMANPGRFSGSLAQPLNAHRQVT